MDPVDELVVDPVTFERETVVIEGGRRLYVYRFAEPETDDRSESGDDPS